MGEKSGNTQTEQPCDDTCKREKHNARERGATIPEEKDQNKECKLKKPNTRTKRSRQSRSDPLRDLGKTVERAHHVPKKKKKKERVIKISGSDPAKIEGGKNDKKRGGNKNDADTTTKETEHKTGPDRSQINMPTKRSGKQFWSTEKKEGKKSPGKKANAQKKDEKKGKEGTIVRKSHDGTRCTNLKRGKLNRPARSLRQAD